MNRTHIPILSLFVTATLAGCAAVAGPPQTASGGLQTARALRPSTTASIFVPDYSTNTVAIYNAAGQSTGSISLRSPGGVAVDASGNLVVASSSTYSIAVYDPPYTKQSLHFKDPDGSPYLISVETAAGADQGELGVVSSTTGYPNVSFFAKGATKPCKTFAGTVVESIFGAAFDASGNLYVVGYKARTNSQPEVGVVTGGCKSPKLQLLRTYNYLSGLQSIAVAPNGDPVIVNIAGGTTQLFEYKPPVHGVLGKPVSSTTLAGTRLITQIAFTPDGTDVWGVDYANHIVIENAYPSGTEVTSFGVSILPEDIAISPAAVP